MRREVFDARWVPCKRPFVIAGGELTLEMLDLRYDETGHFYEAPLHVKALGGCFIIDDFGRQLVSARPTCSTAGLCRSKAASTILKLHTGKSFSIPFEELIIFSTNLEPEDLMDPAFLRRLPYKIEVGPPSLESYREIFEKECAKQGFELQNEAFESIVYKIKKRKASNWPAISRGSSWTRWWPLAGSCSSRRASSRASSTTRSTTCACTGTRRPLRNCSGPFYDSS